MQSYSFNMCVIRLYDSLSISQYIYISFKLQCFITRDYELNTRDCEKMRFVHYKEKGKTLN